MLRWIALDQINPFDPSHVPIAEPPGFRAKDKKCPDEHLLGAKHCCEILRAGAHIRPIAVCAIDKVPGDREQTDRSKAWQRLDGFKRYWGHKLAGATEIACVVHDEFKPGCQHGQPMTVDEAEVGKILQVLSKGEYDPAKWPYQGHIQIEDCETIHVHLGHLRMEFTAPQFMELAGKFREAANTLAKRRGL